MQVMKSLAESTENLFYLPLQCLLFTNCKFIFFILGTFLIRLIPESTYTRLYAVIDLLSYLKRRTFILALKNGEIICYATTMILFSF